jgi:peptide-methionine (S)-S-oxide reductase
MDCFATKSAILFLILATGTGGSGCANEEPTTAPATAVPATKESAKVKTEKATFGAGCFWGVEAEFARVPGVVSTAVGYCGGKTKNPTYKEVCTDETGHAEVIEINFDPTKVSYEQLVDIFWELHDPTTLNRQGPDVGTQYRSVIFHHSPEQKKVADEVIAELAREKVYDDRIVTEVSPAVDFWIAERYHQDYFRNNAGQPYCMWVVAPKVAKFRKAFLAKVKKGVR